MKLVVQRVKRASVTVVDQDKVVGKIGKGLFILVGVGKNDSASDARQLALKLSKLRIMSDDNAKMNLTVRDLGAEILVVSQFTLYSDTSGGNRPSFVGAAKPDVARLVYEEFVRGLADLGNKVATGSFGDYMKISLELDGPVTIVLDSSQTTK